MSRQHLYNSVQISHVSKDIADKIIEDPANLGSRKLSYKIQTSELPKHFIPMVGWGGDGTQAHTVSGIAKGFPEELKSTWFYTDKDGVLKSIITDPLDQAGCGSCWAFASASMFTDRIRLALLKRYGQGVVSRSSFFNYINITTGDIGIQESSGGIVNVTKTNLKQIKERDRISAYYTAAFSPQLMVGCSKDVTECVDTECAEVLEKIWNDPSLRKHSWAEDMKTLGKDLSLSGCAGCEGNIIACPFMLYAGASIASKSLGGVASISQFPIELYACLFGLNQYCPKTQPPNLHKYKADNYVYADKKKAESVNGDVMTHEEWYKKAIYTHGPITVCFGVWDSFMNFYTESNRDAIYTLDDFTDHDKDPSGGHAVVIVGWGERMVKDKLVKFWLVRNSWGAEWGDHGFFRMEINLPKIGFEDEIACVLFADKNEDMFEGRHNDMKEFMDNMDSAMFNQPSSNKIPWKKILIGLVITLVAIGIILLIKKRRY